MADELDGIVPASVDDEPQGRAASVRLRTEQQGQRPQDLLDPAQQSLADALRVTLRFVQAGMFVLLALFIFSGVTTVKEGEIGLQLTFGEIKGEPRTPGAHFAAPYPIGDFVKIDTGTKRLTEEEGFWPYLTPSQRNQSIEQLGGGSKLDPVTDGSLITADGNLVHTQWSIVYRHIPSKARDFAQNIQPEPEQEQAIVRAAARRGIVRAVAQVTIDQLLKETGSGPGSVAAQAEAIAQDTLDSISSGIQIEDMVLAEKMPPLFARDRFAAVQSAEANAQGAIEKARQEASRTLNEAAGGIHTQLRDQILRYEEAVGVHSAAVKTGDEDQIARAKLAMDAVLRDIDALMESDAAGGEVARMMIAAHTYRLEERNRWESAARRFEAKLAQFQANPDVTIQIEWDAAWSRLAENDFVEIMTHPINAGTIRLDINRDPTIMKRMEESIKERMLEESEKRRRLRQEQADFKTQTEILQEG